MTATGTPVGIRRDTSRELALAFANLLAIASPQAEQSVVILMARCFAVQGVRPADAFHKGWNRYGSPLVAGKQPNRVQSNIDARHIAYWLARYSPIPSRVPSYPAIAAACGVPKHTTVLCGVVRVIRATKHEPFGKLASAARRALTTLHHWEQSCS